MMIKMHHGQAPRRGSALVRGRAVLAGVATLAAAAIVTACSSATPTSTGASGAAAGSTLTPITVDVDPLAALTLPYIAQEKGYFTAEGLKVTLVKNNGGASLELPLVTSGKMDIGASGAGDVMPAIMNGAPIKLIAGIGTVYTNDLAKSDNILFVKGSSITRPRDLDGKTVAFNSIGTANQAMVDLAVKNDGGDPSTIKFVQLPVQNIPAAIESGQIDAGQGLEPYLTQAKKMGLKGLLSIGGALPGGPELAYWTSTSFASTHAPELAAFARAMAKAAADANGNIDVVRQALVTAGLQQSVADAIQAPGVFATTATPTQDFTSLASALKEAGLLKTVQPTSDWLLTPGQQ